MSIRPSLPSGGAVRGVASAVLVVLASTLSASSRAESHRLQYYTEVGVILPRTVATSRPRCIDTTATWVFQVVVRNIPDMPMDREAEVVVSSSDGKFRTMKTTGPGSYATIEWPLDQEGVINFTVYATVWGNKSPTEQFSVEVVQCRWRIQVDLEEEYDFSDDQSLTVGATAFLTRDLERRLAQDGMGADFIVLGNGAGSFSLFVHDTLEPLDAVLDPEVTGSLDVRLEEGSVSGGTLSLQLIGSAVGLPEMANIGFKDVTEQANEIYVTAPVPTTLSLGNPYAGRGLDPLARMMLGSVTLPETGGVLETNPDQVFIQSSDRMHSTARLVLSVTHESIPGNY